MNPVVSILIVSYNTRDMTLACLRSVFDQSTGTPLEVIVVDNDSADGSADAIEAEFGGRVSLVRPGENLGFAKANNLAARSAAGEYLLLLNPDTLILHSAIDRLVQFAGTRPEAGIWGGRTVFADGSLNPASCWARPTTWSLVLQAVGLSSLGRNVRLLNPEGYGGWDRSKERQVDIVAGCFLLIRRELWERLGGFDDRYFMYGEEADLCLRAGRLGARPVITPSATIVHHGGASECVRADKVVRLMGAKCRLVRTHWRPAGARVGVWLLAAWVFNRALAWTVLGLVQGAGARDRAMPWRSVWRRRGEWMSAGRGSGAVVLQARVEAASC